MNEIKGKLNRQRDSSGSRAERRDAEKTRDWEQRSQYQRAELGGDFCCLARLCPAAVVIGCVLYNTYVKHPSQDDGIRRWNLWVVIMSYVWNPPSRKGAQLEVIPLHIKQARTRKEDSTCFSHVQNLALKIVHESRGGREREVERGEFDRTVSMKFVLHSAQTWC